MADTTTELMPTHNEDIEPCERYSSSNVIAAAEEIKFQAMQDADAIKHKAAEGKLSKEEERRQLKEAYKTLAHTLDKNQLASEYSTNLSNGLKDSDVNEARTRFGYNELTPPSHDPWWLRLIKSIFGGFFNILLWVGAVLCFISYGIDNGTVRDPTNLYLGIVLSTVVTLTGIFGYYQEGQTSDLMASLQNMNKPSPVATTRNGRIVTVEPRLLVPGDIVDLESGKAVPADVRIFECSPDTEVNNASLTGEADPQKRDWRPESDEIIPGEAKNLLFFGTSLVNGKCRGVIYATGDNTFMGRTAQLATSTEGEETPIAKEIKDFVFKVSLIAFALGITFFIIGMVDNGDLVRNIIFLIGIIVANVPEGLLATVTVSLTLTAKKMFHKNVRVKNLESVETLGSTSVICSDKTGTLTTSVMTCQHVYFDLQECLCDTSNPYQALIGDFYEEDKRRKRSFKRLIRCGSLCNNAEFVEDPNDAKNNGMVQEGANPTEAAMVKFASGHVVAEYNVTVPRFRDNHRKLHEIPFNSKNKWQVSVHEMVMENGFNVNDDEKVQVARQALVQMKGAPERILALCDKYWYEGAVHELNDEVRATIMDGVLALGSKGERVLALAELELDTQEYDIACPEPIAKNDYGTAVDENVAMKKNNASVVVVWNDDEANKYEVNLDEVVNEYGERVKFEELIIRDIGMAFAPKVGLKYHCVRLFYSNKGRLAGDLTLRELGIERGSILYAYKGPYIFQGTNVDSINFPFNRNKDEGGLHFIGLFALIDPPRPGVPSAVLKCQSAGIRVIMVTGDHPVTAKAIARQVNIIKANSRTREEVAKDKYGGNVDLVKADEYDAAVVAGGDLQKILDTEKEDRQGVADFWNETLTKPNVVFARTSPQQKLLIVAAVQQRGGIVAVTGDGVNDSPALKKADIGVAMGQTGTDVAKEAADMILLDDNFASIVNGVEEGRIIFDNLKKSIAYTLSSNIPEIAPFLLYQTVGIPLPLTTVMILLVDLGTDLAPAISMAYEGKESTIMDRKPRNPENDKLVTWKLVSFAYLQIGMLQAIAGFYAYFAVLTGFGISYRMTPGMDKHDCFEWSSEVEQLRDAYWMYCFEKGAENLLGFNGRKGSNQCVYSPEFSFNWQTAESRNAGESCVTTSSDDKHCFYYQSLFESWQKRDEKDCEYCYEMKQHIAHGLDHLQYDGKISESDWLKLLSTTGSVTIDDDKYWLIWNEIDESAPTKTDCCDQGSTYSTCTDVIGSDIAAGGCTVLIFQDIWENTLEPNYYRSRYDVSANYPNRRCQETDYSEYYTSSLHSKITAQCDNVNHVLKPRTFTHFYDAEGAYIDSSATADIDREYSLFPMEMRQRTEALRTANTAYFVSIIIVQWADLMICKTRENSLFEQGMTNTFMNYSLLFETLLGAFLAYVSISNTVTDTRPIRFVWWCPAIPFSLMIYIYDETRKGIIRKYPGSWIHRNTYW